MIAPADITGIVLCGGEGRRMGGVKKPLLLLLGRPFIAHVVERLAPQVGRVIVSANHARDAFAPYGDIIADHTPGLGPLGGLQAALAAVETSWFFCCPGDAPLLDASLVARLAAGVGVHEAAVAHDGERRQHLFLLCRSSALAQLNAYLETGQRAVHGFLDLLDQVEVRMPAIAASFANVNTPEDLEALRSFGTDSGEQPSQRS